MVKKKKIIRITTVPMSLGGLLTGQLSFMKDFYKVIGVSSPAKGRLKEVGEQEGIPVIPIEMTRQITPLKDLQSLWKLYRLFRKERPWIVHTHTPKAGTLGMLAALLAGVPNRLHTVAGLPLMESRGPKRGLLDVVEKLTYASATKVYPNSFGLMDIILSNGYTHKNKLKVIGNGSSNGIDTALFDPDLYSEKDRLDLRGSLGIDGDDFVFVFVGRLVKDKGIEELVTAFDSLDERPTNTRLLLVGSYEEELDPLSPETMNRIEGNANILAVGWQQDVRPFFAISDVLVFPSYREGFPNVVMQAGAMGLFSIVSDINGCNEIIEDSINGQIIPTKNIDALKLAMEKCLVERDLKNKDKEVYRQMIRDRYECNVVWQELLREYRSLE